MLNLPTWLNSVCSHPQALAVKKTSETILALHKGTIQCCDRQRLTCLTVVLLVFCRHRNKGLETTPCHYNVLTAVYVPLKSANTKGLTTSHTVPTAKGISTPGEGLKETNNRDLAEI